jgi:glycine oxidase
MRVVVVGCGIVGAAIAYELSQIPELAITVVDQQHPAQAATGAALGVLMAAISQKPKGHRLQMRLRGIQRYDQWIPELETQTGRKIPYNREGILRLCFADEDWPAWRSLADVRQTQGFPLELYDLKALADQYPQLSLAGVQGAVYSRCDRQLDPVAATLALVDAAEQNGVSFQFGQAVVAADVENAEEAEEDRTTGKRRCRIVHTAFSSMAADWLVIAAGLGSTALTSHLNQPVDIRPVLGQAVHLRLPHPLGNSPHQPVITGDDVHIVPLGGCAYWVGATVEFPDMMPDAIAMQHPQPDRLEAVMQQAIALCPALRHGEILRTWSGLRPRPESRPAPIVERLAGYTNVILATGHYRNGVLLAPATADHVRQIIQA